MALLECRGLGKDYGRVTAVAALDLDVEAGEVFGLLGPNGAGKTTAISMIAGVVAPTRGRAVVAGHDVVRDRFAARAAIGLVPQEVALYDELTPRQNLRFFGGVQGLRGAALAARIDEALALAGLTDRADDRVRGFSGGMKRRLNLVAGLLHHPALVVLDEPTVGVDPQSRNFLLAAIRRPAAGATTVLYTSHYIEEVEALCRRVAIVDHGRFVVVGPVDALIAAVDEGGLDVELVAERGVAAEALGRLGELVALEDGAPLRATLRGAVGVAAVVRALDAAGIEVRAVRTRRPSLETVFLHHTGHTLRDG
jgi:ABC-2 type transport system ATP-binding protein